MIGKMPALLQILVLTLSCTPLLSLALPSLHDASKHQNNNHLSQDQAQEAATADQHIDAALSKALAPKYQQGIFHHVSAALAFLQGDNPELVSKLVEDALGKTPMGGELRRRQTTNTTLTETSITSITPTNPLPSNTGSSQSPPGQSPSTTALETSSSASVSPTSPPGGQGTITSTSTFLSTSPARLSTIVTTTPTEVTTPTTTQQPPATTTSSTIVVAPSPASKISQTSIDIGAGTPLPPFSPPGSTLPAQQTQQPSPSPENPPPSPTRQRTTITPSNTIPITSTSTNPSNGRTTLVTYTPTKPIVVSDVVYSTSTLPGGEQVTITSYETASPQATDGVDGGSGGGGSGGGASGDGARIAEGVASTLGSRHGVMMGWIVGGMTFVGVGIGLLGL